MNPPATNTPTCPRCGYDQSGAVAAWTDSCPTRGTCPECGAQFDWLTAVSGLRRVPGFFEHARGVNSSFVAIWHTAWLVARPWVFWRRVGSQPHPKLRRATGWLALILLFLWLLKGLVGTAFIAVVESKPGGVQVLDPSRGTSVSSEVLNVWGHPVVAFLDWDGDDLRRISGLDFGSLNWFLSARDWGLCCVLVASILWPLMLAGINTDGWTRSDRRHVTRAWLYSMSWLAIPLLFRCELHAVMSLRHLLSPDPHDPTIVPVHFLVHGPGVRALMWFTAWIWLTLWWWFAVCRGGIASGTRLAWCSALMLQAAVAGVILLFAATDSRLA